MNSYKILLGTELNTSDLKNDINALDNKFKLKLGVDVKVDDIRKRISEYNKNTNNAKLKLKVNLDTDDIKKQIKQLSVGGIDSGKKMSIPIDTQSLEASFKEVKAIITDIRNAIGAIDNNGDIKSLVSSINQMASALGKAENESDSLVKSLSALSKKDFGVNIGLDLGKKGNNNMVAYGRQARKQVIPQLEAQIKELEGLFGGQQATIRKLTQHGKNVGFDIFADFEDFNSDSAIKKMEAMEKYIGSLKKLASIDNVSLDGFNTKFSKTASELIDDIAGVDTAVDKASDIPEKLKNIFGSGVNADNLNIQLDDIVTNLNEIKTALQGLSSGNPLGGLTQSFDRLSGSIENLLKNAEKVKGVLGSSASNVSVNTGSVSGVNVSNKIEQISDASTSTVIKNEKKKQEAYKATTDTVMYHAGIVSKLNKAETNGRFYGSNRGTGYFGTGHYFVDSATKHQLDNSPSYRKLPYTSIDISQYDNLFKVTSDEIGYELHRFLKNLTRFTQGADDFSVDELFAQFKNVFGNAVMDVKEFGSKMEQLKSFMSKSDFYDRSDSVSTQFMKSLGYGGVDTRGTRLADTEYGTVIYDLKEESVLQANITDELQKQGQMLEKINYEKGQVFDKDTDATIQGKLDEQAKRKEIADEFERSFDTSNLDKVSDDLADIKKRIDDVNGVINKFKYNLDNLDQAYEDDMNFMKSLGFDDDDFLFLDDKDEWKENHAEIYKSNIEELSAERAELEAQASALEEVRNKESQLANEAYERAKQTVEQRRLEAQAIKQVSDATDSIGANTGLEKVENDFREIVSVASNLDDVIDQEVLGLMKTFSIDGDKGSKAFNEIRQALVECRNELQILKNADIGIDEEVFDTSRAFDKVSDAIANQLRAVNSLGDEYIKLAEYMTNFNKAEKGNKVRVPDFIKQEQGDDYGSTRGSLGIAFNTERGISFASFIEDINDVNNGLGVTIDLTKGEEKAYEELVDKVRLGREQIKARNKSQSSLQATASTDEILAQNYINKNEIRDVAESSIDYINAAEAAEKALAQVSTQSTNVVTQNEERKQQAYQETANIIQSVSKQTSLVRGNVDFEQVFNSGNQSAKEAQKYFEALLKEEKAVVSVKENFDKSLGNSGELKSFTVDIQRATGEVEKLHYAMSSADNDNRFLYQGASVSDRNIEKQTEARIKSADKLQTQLEKIKSDYNDMGNAKPIKDSDHINALDKQYRRVEKAIDDIRNADNTMSSSVISNAEKQKSALEAMVREYRNAETLATSLRSKDINTVGATYSSDLDVLISKMRKDGVYTSGFEKGAENLRSVLSDAVANKDKNGLVGFLNGLDKLEAGYKRASAAKKEFNQSESVGIDTSTLRSRIENLQRISPEIDKFETEINGARVTVKSLLNDLDNIKVRGDFNVVNKRFNSFEKAAESAGIAVKELSQSSVKASFAKEINQEINDFIELQKQIENTRFEVGKLEITGDSTNQITELKRQLEELENTYDSLMQAFLKKVSVNADIVPDDALSKLDNGITEATTNANNRLEQFKAKWADTRAELAKGIKADIELGNFDEQIDNMRVKFNSLSDANDELRLSYNATEDAYEAMMNAAKANTGDEVADRERLIQAEKEYAAALEKTNNLIKQQARADKIANDALKLEDNRDKFQAKIDSWMANNSAATKRFGAQLLDLRAKAENVDQVGLNHLEAELYKIDKAADKAGLKMMSFGDNIKSKFKQYMAYFSVAEVFMYAEQALRSMFEQVKLIDSAMTELKKVTDETDASYNKFLTNAATRAREIGTTIDGLVSSTADFARLGYGFEDSQGLAEVANIYAVVGDEIEGVEGATQSLISTMAAFKGEMNGMSDSDFAMRIIDVYNEIGNNFAISSGGLGEALQRSASSLAAANNTLDESVSLITAANEVVQSPEKVGNALKTISMRLRGAKTELEEMGEDTSGMVESTSTLRAEIQALSGVDIMASATEFKSTYQILDELSKKWEDLSDITQATIIEKMAGKHQGNVFASLMENFDTARSALETSLNSSGSALAEHEKWQQSLEANDLPRRLEIND